jgi:hypothetical protein
MQLDLRFAKENLSSSEKDLENIHKLLANVVVGDSKFSQLSLMTELQIKKEFEIFKVRQVVSSLEAALAVPYTQPAEALEEIFVSELPVSPKKALLLVLGLIGGLFSGFVSVFLVDAWRRRKERH